MSVSAASYSTFAHSVMTRLPSAYRYDWYTVWTPESRMPKTTDARPDSTGSTRRDTSSGSYSRSASNGSRCVPEAASAPVFRAAPFPRFSVWRMSRRRGSSMSSTIAAVASSDPSSTTISSLEKGMSVARISVTARPIVASSLKAGMTIESVKGSAVIDPDGLGR